MRILLVDDHVLFREGISSLLSAQPDMTIVGSASNVEEAISKARELKPDIVLMDFTLPDGTGLEATEAILTDRPDTMIVFLTVHEDDERLFATIRSGVKGYLPKNISMSDLVSYLRGIERGEAAITPKIATRIFGEFAQTDPVRKRSGASAETLTTRELEVLRVLETGASNQEIAARLTISEQTVKNHVSNILSKLKVRNRYEAADFARRHGLVGPSYGFE